MGETETNRVEAFSDGVLAIVITLLVLEIKVPHLEHATDAAIWAALQTLTPKIVAWVVSFVFVLVFWVAHHYLFNAIEKVDRNLLWLNGLFLLCISFTPFPTAFAGDYPLSAPPLALLSGVMFAAATSFMLMRLYALGRGRIGTEHLAAAKAALGRSMLAPVLYAAGAVAALFEPIASVAILALVPLMFVIPASKG